MPTPELDKLPPVLYFAAVVGTALAGFVAYLAGLRTKSPSAEQQRIDARDAELIEARALQRLQLVVSSAIEALRTEMNAMENRHRQTHQEMFERLRDIERK